MALGGRVGAFVAAEGTGGTLAGTGSFLREQNEDIALVCPDPLGAAMWSWFTKNLEDLRVTTAYRIPDQEALSIIYQLRDEEGLFLGLSSGINVAGALRFARERRPGQTIVTVLCDSGAKYQSKIYNPRWLSAHGLDPRVRLTL